MIPKRSRLGLVVLVVAPAVAAAQRPAPAPRAAVRADTVEH